MAQIPDVPERACPDCVKLLVYEGSLGESRSYEPGAAFSTEPTEHVYRCDSCGRKYSGGNLCLIKTRP